MIRRRIAACVVGLVLATGAVGAIASPPREGFPADPPVHATEKQWVFEVKWDKGASAVASARSANAKKPIATARAMGRFAIEFWVGKELLDRIRFDVPLLGDDAAYRDNKSFFKRPTFTHVTTKVTVQMADAPRATVLAFVDRSTGETRKYFWPPDEKGQLTPFSAKAAIGDASAVATTSAAPAATSAPTAGTSAPASGTAVAAAGTGAPAAGTSAPAASASAAAPNSTAVPNKAAPGNSAAPDNKAAPGPSAAAKAPAPPKAR